jgi:hypothetical protein
MAKTMSRRFANNPSLIGCLLLALSMSLTTACQGDVLTTTFLSNNGQSGNMFDINVLAVDGIMIEGLEINLDPGTWNVSFYTKDSTYLGFETNSAAWTLRETIVGLASAGTNNPTSWNIGDFYIPSGTEAFYIRVTNGTALNYTNGTVEGALYASNADLQIFQGTGNAGFFGQQFRPRIWNGSIIYSVVPEPATTLFVTLGLAGITLMRRRRS